MKAGRWADLNRLFTSYRYDILGLSYDVARVHSKTVQDLLDARVRSLNGLFQTEAEILSIVAPAGSGEAEELHVLGVNLRFLCRPEDTGSAWSMMENVIPRDAGPPPHHHAEAYYLISGEVEFDINGTKTSIKTGDFVYAPAGTVHAFRGISEEPSRMLIIDAPAHAEAFFTQVDRDVSDLRTDGHKIPAIGAANGIHFLQPA